MMHVDAEGIPFHIRFLKPFGRIIASSLPSRSDSRRAAGGQ